MAATTATRPPRAPQDRKPKQSEALAAEAQAVTPEGAELLRIDDLPAWDQADILADITDRFASLGVDMTDLEAVPDIPLDGNTMRTLGQLMKSLVPYAKDEKAFTELLSGPGAFQRGMDLSMWYFGALGEGSSSAN